MIKTGRQPKTAVGMILLCLALSTFGEATEQGWRTLDGESRDPGRAERLIRDLMGPYSVNALAAAVIQDGRIIFICHAGHIDENRLVKVGDQTVFRAASMGKPVFAYLVARLADEGLFDLDRPIERILGKPLDSFPGYRDLAGDGRQKLLTPRLLLSHQSGFPNWRRMTQDRLAFLSGPGDRFGYSGKGYRLLQFVLETITGEKLDRLARQKVFLPLGMEQSSFLWETRFDGRFAVQLDTGLVLLTACGEKIGIAAKVSRVLIGDRYSPFSWMGY